ncbi:MAG: UDP-N-acetylmuramoyl-L-alanine--D-glutamate ligase [Candidatus Margulisiibacteriota bacterium]
MDDLKNKKVAVFGIAKSGIASARKLVSLGARVTVTEIKPASDLDSTVLEELQNLQVDMELGGHSSKVIESAEMIVVSPGVHLDISILKEAKQRRIPIISEIELAYRLLSKPIIAVTGTNGKTTTTTLIGELLKAGGKRVAVAGNIGSPLVEVDDAQLDYIVAEISSYQLESIDEFKPWISVILNIQPDHLERHKTMDEYIHQKARIFMNQSSHDYVIFNMDDPQVAKMVKGARAKLVGFTRSNSEIITLAPSEIKIPGRHNLENALAAVQAAYLCGVEKKTVAEVLRTFPGIEHRIEFVSKINGIEFYNDSKATNPDSTLVALETFQGRGIILILGGLDKGVTLDTLCHKVKEGVRDVVLIGAATKRFKEALEKAGYAKIHLAHSLEEAVQTSSHLGKAGDVVLLSPACASFDRFSNFEERGRVFKEAVRKI